MIHQPLKIRASKTLLKMAGVALLLSLPFGSAFADTVSSASPAWVLLPNSIGPNTGTWALPASSATCGVENELSCEPTGDFIFSNPLNLAVPAYFTMTSSDTTTSDLISVANTGPGGTGEILFFSDPNPGVLTPPAGYFNGGSLCTELLDAGCVATTPTITTSDGTTFTVSAASDDEATFDPFLFGFDSSDQIQFNGVTPVGNTPEPSSLLLLGTGLVGLAGVIRRKLS